MPGQKAAFTLPEWLDSASIEYAVKILTLYFTGGVAPASPSGPSTGPVVTLTSSAATGNGSVPAGAKSASFVTSSDWVGTINGASFPASAAKSITPPQGSVLPAIAYTRSAGTLYIDTIT